MSKEKKQRIKMTTPPGIFIWPKLNQINYGSEKYPVKDGNFEVKISIDKTHPEFAAFAEKFEPLYAQAKELALMKFAEQPVSARKTLKEKNGPEGIRLRPAISQVYDEKTEEPLDSVTLKATMPAGGIIKHGPKAGQVWMRRPVAFDAKGREIPLFNAQGNPLASAPRIWSGTLGRVAFEVDTNKDGTLGYFVASDGTYGIRLSLQGVKLLRLAAAQQATAESMGFGGEEEGFDYDSDSTVQDESDSTTHTSQASGISGDF